MSITDIDLQTRMNSGLTAVFFMLSVSASNAFAQSYLSDQSIDGLLLAQSYSDSAEKNVSRLYGPVKEKENLWAIAKTVRPAYTTMSQVVMAIFRRNPDDFHNQDINRLKTGAILEIPAVSEMQAINHRQAYAEINKQIAGYESEIAKQEKADINTAEPVTAEETTQIDLVQVDSNDGVEAEQEAIETIKTELVEDEAPVIEPVLEVSQVEAKPKPASNDRPLFRYSYDLSLADDDNVRRAQEEADIRSDVITSITLNARGGKPLDSFSILSYGGSITYENFDVFEDLNNLNFNINVKYRFATSASFTAPLYSFGAKLGGIDSESEMRDSSTFSVSFDYNKWLTTAINLTTGIGYNVRESKSEVFDTSEGRVFLNLDLNLSKAALVYGTYTYIRGDIVSSATPSLTIINTSEVIESDDAFGGLTTNQFAYRIDAESQVLTLGYNHIMTRSLSIDLSYRYVDSVATENDDIYYDRTILRASLLGRF